MKTIATVGYGDITPKTELGRAVMMCLMVAGAILIPIQLNRLGDLISAHSGNTHTKFLVTRFKFMMRNIKNGVHTLLFLDILQWQF